MKGVILAGGSGTRLRPLTNMINKHLLPVGRYPMIYYSIKKLYEAGIEDILIIMGKHSAGLYTDYLGSGQEWGVRITYKIQEEAGGIAQALALSDGFVNTGDKFVTLLGDNLFEDSLASYVQKYEEQDKGAMVMLKKVTDPRRYGVPILNENKIIFIEEKPSTPKSNYCVTGIYMYDSDVFKIIKQIEPSNRGEMEITDVNNVYAAEGHLAYSILNGWWTDAGTFDSLHEAAAKLLTFDGDPQ
ncbi:sugar phosphate nucleotidyltransferase [Paenibacillus sp. J2TS4]|uniref:sugar phosphate nucleotidyltransferase n=1 Tax=Paenibacillus sp. J2TS4 TaxID=2807194 RepID=UPI001AFF67A9|nr:sugar phosphate nucleotidyltransferase [Paenibacillus sp. J2TS4]GIP31270.1 glucose-1-phosphate thymidylyltransferase [Paenibacillus sp. J2TS4]